MNGSLVVVGTGIGAAQLTTEARAEIAAAEEVFFLAGDPVSEQALLALAPSGRSLAVHYDEEEPYEAMTEAILRPARDGIRVCAAFYGHPGVFVWPAGEAIRRARDEGLPARMLPAVSAIDCLFADLGVDPAAAGCQIYEAGDLLRRRPSLDAGTPIVLLQAGVARSREELVAALGDVHARSHELVLYEASPYPGVPPLVERVPLGELATARLSERSTVYVPPGESRGRAPRPPRRRSLWPRRA